MKQTLFIFIAASITLGLVYFTWSHPSLPERDRLQHELTELQAQNTRAPRARDRRAGAPGRAHLSV
jgi:hypothetical protein